MPLLFDDRTRYSHGEARYYYRSASQKEGSPRILVPVEIEGIETLAVVDTAADYTICDPEIAEEMGLDPAAAERMKDFQARGIYFDGYIFRMSIRFISQPGERDITLEAPVFVPFEDSAETWKSMGLQSFIGMLSCLERLRIAIDPDKKMFYFGDPLLDFPLL